MIVIQLLVSHVMVSLRQSFKAKKKTELFLFFFFYHKNKTFLLVLAYSVSNRTDHFIGTHLAACGQKWKFDSLQDAKEAFFSLKSRTNYIIQSNKNRPFRSDFDGTPRRNSRISESIHGESLSCCTLYNKIMKYPRLPRLIPLVGLETGFCALLPKNFDEL